MSAAPSRALALTAVVAVLLVPACESGSGLDRIPVSVRGVVTGQGDAPVEGVWVHLLAGPQNAPRGLTAAQTDVSGVYEIEIEVEPADCNDLHVRVLETQAFDADAEPLDSSLLGSCSDFTDIDFVVDVEPPVPGAQ